MISKICKQFIEVNIKNNVIKKWAEDLYRPLLQGWPTLTPWGCTILCLPNKTLKLQPQKKSHENFCIEKNFTLLKIRDIIMGRKPIHQLKNEKKRYSTYKKTLQVQGCIDKTNYSRVNWELYFYFYFFTLFLCFILNIVIFAYRIFFFYF